MTAPSPSVRQTPSGRHLGDGYKTLITFAVAPAAAYWEKSVTPPGLDGGDPIDTTTQQNVRFRTKHPRRLIDLTPTKMSALYDPVLYSTFLAIINVKTTITITFPDHSTLAAYGYLKSFVPSGLEDGAVPMAEADVVFTNEDPTLCTEEAPTYTAGGGTGC